MPTECSPKAMRFARVKSRDLVADFDGGAITSDGGAVLLGAVDRAVGLVRRFSNCFTDGRRASHVEYDLPVLIGQRVFGIALGYEDLIDHDALRHDPLLGAVLGRLAARRPDCAPLAGKSTLHRLEHAPADPDRYRKIGHDPQAIEGLFVDLFLDAHESPPKEIILDLDATDDRLHGDQEGKFFHGYYDGYCYLPLYVFCGDHLLAAKLRRANIDGAAGAVEETARIVARLRARWPEVRIILRADAGFARDALMGWCETHGVDYLFGLARNKNLAAQIAGPMDEARGESEHTGAPARRFVDFEWRTRKSWSRARRVIAKAEWLPTAGDGGGHSGGKANARFVVTSLTAEEIGARALYEDVYCARGEMENRIKEQQLDLFADRTSAATMRANQLRLWFASMAYALLAALRRSALAGTRLARATCGSIRLRLFKIGALVRISVRRIRIAMNSAHPWADEFRHAHERLCP